MHHNCIIDFIPFTNGEYQAINEISDRTASREISELVNSNILEQAGTFGAGSYYQIKRQNNAKTAKITPSMSLIDFQNAIAFVPYLYRKNVYVLFTIPVIFEEVEVNQLQISGESLICRFISFLFEPCVFARDFFAKTQSFQIIYDNSYSFLFERLG